MILTNRLFERKPPGREAKSIYIFCEGAKREYQYFEYFKEMDSRINVEIYKLHPHEDNSPLGLLTIAKKCIIANEESPIPKYMFQENDEVWIVLDTDIDKDESRKPQIKRVNDECELMPDWFVAQSNPCFEVWLYYHFCSDKPVFVGNEYCINWKDLVNKSISGGFDSRKHPIFIESASENAEKNFESKAGEPTIGSTEVFKLSKSIFSLVKTKIERVLEQIDSN
ncbi:MAG: RloB domain-containing protein [bacterium]|nr:RloB domain-containing protein [bacterium]